ncbi:hypothetical protein [Paenibacillus sinopodophylli]|uniref:hypothetical protein n=1 Tax=Paenibacillus sinopodophylli TaxID=1837342 RepID=UPI00110CF652|nr:hypothetical protein [Paenibacillus sinopodophylli]
MIYTGIILASVIIQNIILLMTQPDKYKTWVSVFNLSLGIILTMLAVYFYFDAYKPKTGPVGNGRDDDLIMTNFIVMTVAGGSFIIIGIIGIYVKRKLKHKTNGGGFVDKK